MSRYRVRFEDGSAKPPTRGTYHNARKAWIAAEDWAAEMSALGWAIGTLRLVVQLETATEDSRYWTDMSWLDRCLWAEVTELKLDDAGLAAAVVESQRRARRNEASKRCNAKKAAKQQAEWEASHQSKKQKTSGQHGQSSSHSYSSDWWEDLFRRMGGKSSSGEAGQDRAQAPQASDWDLLGVSPSTPKSEIKKAWLKLVQIHHPDRGGDVSMMQKINAAYDRVGR